MWLALVVVGGEDFFLVCEEVSDILMFAVSQYPINVKKMMKTCTI